MKRHDIAIDGNRCTGCQTCKKDCPQNNIYISENKAVLRSQVCIKCGHCVAVCPQAAVSMSGFEEPPVKIQKPNVLNPEELLRALQTRRTVRQFKNLPVSSEIITRIIVAGQWTPSGKNAQDVSYVVLKDGKERYEKIAVKLFRRLFPLVKFVNPNLKNANIDDNFFFKNASAVILVLSKDSVNGALAASNMSLMAESFGLGVLYSGFFSLAVKKSHKLKKALGLTRKDKAVTALVIGYPNVRYLRTVQKEKPSVRFV